MVSTTEVYEALQQLPGKEAAKKVADFLEEKQQFSGNYVTKDDLKELRTDLKNDMRWFAGIVIAVITIVITIAVFILKF